MAVRFIDQNNKAAGELANECLNVGAFGQRAGGIVWIANIDKTRCLFLAGVLQHCVQIVFELFLERYLDYLYADASCELPERRISR
jgi:hypothetical protein